MASNQDRTPAAVSDRLLTVPNALSVARLAGVPLFLWLVLVPKADGWAVGVLVLAGLSDWLDGKIARAWHQQSRFGEMLDPAADRLYIAATLIALALRAIIPWWLLGLLCRPRTAARRGAFAVAAPRVRSAAGEPGGQGGHALPAVCVPIAVPWFAYAVVSQRLRGSPVGLLQSGERLCTGGQPGSISSRRAGWSGGHMRQARWRPDRKRRGELSTVKAVVMAGGEGTRLRPMTANQPKPLLPVANKPIMEYVLRLLKRHGFSDTIVTTAFLASLVRNYFGDGEDFGMRLQYATEEMPLGTAGSVKNAEDALRDGPFVVISGDALTDIDLSAMVRSHKKNGALVTIGLTPRAEPARIRDHHRRR